MDEIKVTVATEKPIKVVRNGVANPAGIEEAADHLCSFMYSAMGWNVVREYLRRIQVYVDKGFSVNKAGGKVHEDAHRKLNACKSCGVAMYESSKAAGSRMCINCESDAQDLAYKIQRASKEVQERALEIAQVQNAKA